MNEWLERAGAELGIDVSLSDEDVDALLKIARIAAHTSDDRRTAPILTYLIGRANGSPVELLEALQRSS